MQTRYSQSGFSLIELSMVLAIVVLIIGGVTLGRSMIQTAALQSVVADYDKYRNAILAYREKYNELPGDHSTAANNPGNGNSFIGDADSTTSCTLTSYQEPFYAWQHLSNASLVSNAYTGTTTAVSPGTNVPLSKTGASYMLSYYKNAAGCASYSTVAGHVLYLGTPSSTSLPFTGAAFLPEDAKAIDLKIDDGKPGLGKVMTPNATTQSGCASTDTFIAVYSAATTPKCSLILFLGF
jgi:prepilin-type N-terminal cleavage/methylation domain-containing protein